MKKAASLQQILTRARTQLLLNQPFFGVLCLRLKLVEGGVPTMSTDGRRIIFNPEFVRSLQPEELQAVLAHEVMHCALGHHCRRGQRNPRLWNEAADFAINPLLVSNGFSLPRGALLDTEFENLSAEEIYTRLQAKSEADRSSGTSGLSAGEGCAAGDGTPQERSRSIGQSESTQGKESLPSSHSEETSSRGGFGDVCDATDEEGGPASVAERARQQHEWSIAAEQSMRSASACGHEPLGIDRPLEESRRSQQNWREILRHFVSACSLHDYRWTPPNRRFISSGMYLPSIEDCGLGTIVIAVDTSGSIREHQLQQFAGEISSICDETHPESIVVIYCDAKVQGVDELGSSAPVELAPKGGGGTDFRPVFNWIEDKSVQPTCLIYLTDLCCHSYPDPPEYPVLWVTDGRRIAPFGETLQLTGD